jgi:outer membrane biosynthesis protein TonB
MVSMTDKQYGILGTIIIHGILILLLLFSIMSLPKPAPPEGGLLINFGDVISAGGPDEPALNNNPAPKPQEAEKQPAPEKKEGIMTQDFEKAAALPKTPEKKKTEKPKAKPVEKKPAPVKKPVEKAPVVNSKALYSNKGQSTTEKGTSEGIYKGQGNMGDPNGTPESDNYSQGLGGSGITFNLGGRSIINLRKPEFNVLKEGIVVVEITVDRNGKVISAAPGAKGSTLVDNTLYAAAKKAALESAFNVKSDAPERQVGTIAYHFKLQ